MFTAERPKADTPTEPAENRKSEVRIAPTKPDLSQLMAEIRADATDDPLHYLVRSNTAHDGE